jgi:subtilisin family serine protease
MDTIKLTRGRREVTFVKVPDKFAVRGGATSADLIKACRTVTECDIAHAEFSPVLKLNTFSVLDPASLDEAMDTLRAAPKAEFVSHVYSLEESPNSEVIPTGKMVVQFKSDVPKEEREKILEEFGLQVIRDLDFLSNGYSVKLTSESRENPMKIAEKLQGRKEIDTAEPDLGFKVEFLHRPEDPLYKDQWHLNNTGELVGCTKGADVKAEEAWNYTRGSRDITICLMDDGFDLSHPDLSGPGKIVAPRDFADNDYDPNPSLEDDNHGTSCAGVALAEENGIGVVGLAPKCAFMPIRMNTMLSDLYVVAMFQYAMVNNADVISCSWGYEDDYVPLSTAIDAMIHKAASEGRKNKKGCVILFAAGNDNVPIDGEKKGSKYLSAFAAHREVMAIGASNSYDKRSSYSNYGPELSVCAPSNSLSGRGIVTTDRRGGLGYDLEDYTYTFGGTSSATPLVAGLAGLILSIDPELTSAEVKSIVMETADKIDLENGLYVDGHSPLYGHGRINANRAVKRASKEDGVPTVLSVEHQANKPIPDLGSVEDTIEVSKDAAVKALEVNVNIKHTWIGDLRLILKSPQGVEIVLQDRTGWNAHDLVKSFRSSSDPEIFAPVIGVPMKGSWLLKVQDTSAEDVGILVNWGLSITY